MTQRHIIGLMVVVAIFSLGIGIRVERHVILGNDALTEFSYNFSKLTDNYYKEVNEEELLYSAFNNILEELGDPYTMNISNEFFEELSNKSPELGIEVFIDDKYSYFVSDVVADSKASKTGIQKGDKILKINGQDCQRYRT